MCVQVFHFKGDVKIMVDIMILALVIGYCIFVIVHQHKKKKAAAKNGCNGICVGCSGCGDISHLKEEYFADQKKAEKRGI